MLIEMVETELGKRKQEGKYNGEFKGQSHFFGYSIYYIIIPYVVNSIEHLYDAKRGYRDLGFFYNTINLDLKLFCSYALYHCMYVLCQF